MQLSEYQQGIVQYNFHCEQAVEAGKAPKIPVGLSDVFRVFQKNGARVNQVIIDRLERNHGIETFKRKERKENFDKVCLYIAANTQLKNRTFSTSGCQSQIGDRIGLSQATISRILELMCKMEVIRPAFPNKDNPNSSAAAVVGDKHGIPLNHVYEVLDDFALLAGPTAGAKMARAMERESDKEETQSGFNLRERLVLIRNELWEKTIKKRAREITKGCFKKTVSNAKDLSQAAELVYKRMKKHEPDVIASCVTEGDLLKQINARVKQYYHPKPN